MAGVHESLAAIAKHGYLVLFAWITAEQLGAPVPAVPIFIAAGDKGRGVVSRGPVIRVFLFFLKSLQELSDPTLLAPHASNQ